jgi:hypothetical protein
MTRRKKASGTGRMIAVLSQTTLFPGDVPDHAMSLTTRLDVWHSSDPEWNDVRVTGFFFADYSGMTGANRGHEFVDHPGGDRTFDAFEGVSHGVMKPDGTWEATFEGTWRFTGGTGRYAGITGGGTFRGTRTASWADYQWECEYEVPDR